MVLAQLHGERFQDRSPAAVYATLLDEGQYLCSIRTMYRVLEQQGESRERRDQLTHPPYQVAWVLCSAAKACTRRCWLIGGESGPMEFARL